jgi:hypothetical protein
MEGNAKFIWKFKDSQRHHLPHCSTLSVANSPPKKAYKSTICLGMTQESPNQLKKTFQIAQATSQWSRIWSINSSFLIHKQHQSTTMTCRFRKLSMVRIFPRASKQPKNAPPQWNLSSPNTFPNEIDTIMTTHDTVEGFNTKQPLFGRDTPRLVTQPLQREHYLYLRTSCLFFHY